MHDLRSIVAHGALLVVLVAGVLFVVHRAETTGDLPVQSETTQSTTTVATSTIDMLIASSSATSTVLMLGTSTATSTKKAKKASIQATKSPTVSPATSSPNDILRIENPYSTPPQAFESINISARAALVNILCSTKTGGSLKPITGSGIMVDSRGIILTNAHVAQYVLIAQSNMSDLFCTVRTGAPAAGNWVPVVMYIPSVWINEHAADIVKSHALGTGEHDYALLYVASTTDGSPLPHSFSAVTPDSREAIAFVDDSVLVASYPVEFVGGGIISSDLFPVSSIATIGRLLTFNVGSADVLSVGGVIGAQSGSSGGGVVNQWNRLVGLITTTSDGATTAERDLHAITTGYINRDLKAQTGHSLSETLAQDPRTASETFLPEAKKLTDALIAVILGH
jgi:hypothetical protein